MAGKEHIPVVLAISGHDPGGGAGIQADIEAVASMGCHAASVISCLTVQDTREIKRVQPVDAMLMVEQARAILEDLPVQAVKIGLLGSVTAVEVVHTLLQEYDDLPVVLDPILAAGGDGRSLADPELIAAMTELLFPQTTILTPNSLEARRLSPAADTLDACGQALLAQGCEFVLITGAHEPGETVQNRLYGNHRLLETYQWERLPYSYHGSGCTLASAIAALLAQGVDPMVAVHEAQDYTWQTLQAGYQIGSGQHQPDRFFWSSILEED